jgi:hypothetical protein
VAAQAATVNELEQNNSVSTAQTIPTSAFTLPVPATVFNPPGFPTASISGGIGGGDVDLYRVSGHGQIILDIDSGEFDTDTIVSLFTSNELLAFNDDMSLDPGSPHLHDSLVIFDLPHPGVYFVAVTHFANFPCDEHLGPCAIDTAFDRNEASDEPGPPYILHISLEHSHRVPAPGTLILVGVACGVGAIMSAFRRRETAVGIADQPRSSSCA